MPVEKGAIEHGLQPGFHDILVELVSQCGLHQGQGIAHGGIAGAHIQPVTVRQSGPAVTLAAVTGIVIGVIGVGDYADLAATKIVHNAVCRLGVLRGVRDLFKLVAIACIVNNLAVQAGCRRLRPYGKRSQRGSCQHYTRQHYRENSFFHFYYHAFPLRIKAQTRDEVCTVRSML